jgi:hypothetical protein
LAHTQTVSGKMNVAYFPACAPPLPRGERVGVRGFGLQSKKLGVPNSLILSFSPISALTRVFDALWGRRDAACRPSTDGAMRMLHFFGRPLHMIAAHRVATRGQ